MSTKRSRKNSWTVKNFVKLLNDATGPLLGVSNNEQIVDIKIVNNTVVIEITKKLPKYGSRRGR
jgi:hypothetical protein